MKPDGSYYLFYDEEQDVFKGDPQWPVAEAPFSSRKLAGNKARDKLVARTLRIQGWRALRNWTPAQVSRIAWSVGSGVSFAHPKVRLCPIGGLICTPVESSKLPHLRHRCLGRERGMVGPRRSLSATSSFAQRSP